MSYPTNTGSYDPSRRRAAGEWKRNQQRAAAQERAGGRQINPGVGVSEADMLAASAIGRRHGLVATAAEKTVRDLEGQAKVCN